jgi:predicted signal transduction protein with EAL and GGDEF domain
VLQGADLALNHAKLNGRKQIVSFNPSMTRDLIRRKEIEAELRLALQRDELSVHFQPLVDLETGRIRAFEALVRWFHPEKGELRPDEFIPVAEESGAIITLGNWITAKAARVAAEWPDDVTLAVNLSPLQIRAPGAALGILNALREAKLPPHRLELKSPKPRCWITAPIPRRSSMNWPGRACVLRWMISGPAIRPSAILIATLQKDQD